MVACGSSTISCEKRSLTIWTLPIVAGFTSRPQTLLGATGGPSASAAEIAGHLVDALPMGDPTEAAEAALVAGRESLARHAPADAARQLERGLAVLGGDASTVRGAMLLALGEAQSTAGDQPGARGRLLGGGGDRT